MPSSGVPIAPISKRVLAQVIDLLIVGGIFGVPYCTPGFPGVDSAGFHIVLWLTFFAYQVAGLLRSNLGIGRLVQRIEVVDAITGHAVTTQQATSRAAVRTVMMGTAAALVLEGASEGAFLVPAFVELLAIELMHGRQSLADRTAGTIVVTSPPYQPHRAPAAPMYSKSDDEFGPRP